MTEEKELWKNPYYSLRTEDKEYCVEPLLFDEYYWAEYDLQENLLNSKKQLKESEVRTKMAELEEKTKKRFVVKYIWARKPI